MIYGLNSILPPEILGLIFEYKAEMDVLDHFETFWREISWQLHHIG